jgi:nucleotide-binding universal stress UspA family protein
MAETAGHRRTEPPWAAGPVLVGVDVRPRAAIAVGAWLARTLDREVLLAAVHEVDRRSRRRPELEAPARRRKANLLSHRRARVKGLGVPCRTRLVTSAGPVDGLRAAIEEAVPALVVVGVTHRTASTLKAGGTAQRLVGGAQCPIVVVPAGAATPRTIAVAYDASPGSDAALALAATLARSSGGGLAVWHVRTPAGPVHAHIRRTLHQTAVRMVARGLGRLPQDLLVEAETLEGTPADELAARARQEAVGLLVAGMRGYGAAGDRVCGGTVRRLLLEPPCALAMVPVPAR